MDSEPRTIRVEKRRYSRLPWRLIDPQTGRELTVDSEPFDHRELGPMTTGVPGYETKADAVEALGRLAAIAYEATIHRNTLLRGIQSHRHVGKQDAGAHDAKLWRLLDVPEEPNNQ